MGETEEVRILKNRIRELEDMIREYAEEYTSIHGAYNRCLVYESILFEYGYDVSELTILEYRVHFLVRQLEKGYQLQNKEVAKDWLCILKEIQDPTSMNATRLQKAINQIENLLKKVEEDFINEF